MLSIVTIFRDELTNPREFVTGGAKMYAMNARRYSLLLALMFSTIASAQTTQPAARVEKIL